MGRLFLNRECTVAVALAGVLGWRGWGRETEIETDRERHRDTEERGGRQRDRDRER